jgi:AcrR family transcriptional regulator
VVVAMTRASRDGSRLSVPPATGKVGGRRRNEDVHRAVLTATVALLDEPTVGLSRLTIEGVALRAGVSKATIYRWWGGKTDLIVEAYLAKAARDVPVPDTGAVRQDLIELLGRLAFALTKLGSGRTMSDFVVEAHSNSTFGDRFRATLLSSRRQAMAQVLERGQQRGEIRRGAQLTVVIDALYGAMYHRLLMSRETIDGEYVRNLVSTAIDGVADR